jgi:hypothetical protein
MHSVLGERFVKVRSNPNKWMAATRALGNEGHEEIMRQELANGVRTFIESLSFSTVPEPTEDQAQEILKMAMYVALMRANVWVTYGEGRQVVDMEVITSEVPTRIAKQLKHLVKLLAVIRGHPDHISEIDMGTLARVARDTAEIKKQLIMEYYVQWGIDGDYDPNDIAGSTPKLFRTNVRNHFNILTSLECMELGDRGYRLTEQFKPYLQAAFRQGHIPLPQDSLQKKPENGLFSKHTGGKGIGGTLQERLDAIRSHLQQVYMDPTTEEVAEEMGLGYDETAKLLGVLEKDRRVFQVRPGYWRLS